MNGKLTSAGTILTTILARPDGIAVIGFLVLLGMVTGYIPSPLSAIPEIRAEHAQIQQSIQTAVAEAEAQRKVQTQLLRSICLILAETRDDRQLCNPYESVR